MVRVPVLNEIDLRVLMIIRKCRVEENEGGPWPYKVLRVGGGDCLCKFVEVCLLCLGGHLLSI